MILSSNVHISTLSNIKQTQGCHTRGQNLNSGMPPTSMLFKLTVLIDRQYGHCWVSWKHESFFYNYVVNQWMHTGKTCVGTPTWQHISFLCSVLCHPSQQDSLSLVSPPPHPPKPSTAFHHDTSATGDRSTSHAYQLNNGRKGRPLELRIKRGPLGESQQRSGLPIRNGVLLHKQLIHPMMDFAEGLVQGGDLPHWLAFSGWSFKTTVISAHATKTYRGSTI